MIISSKKRIAGILPATMGMRMHAMSVASQALTSNAYLVASYLTSESTASAMGTTGTTISAGRDIGSALYKFSDSFGTTKKNSL